MKKPERRALQLLQRVHSLRVVENLNDYPSTTLPYIKTHLVEYPHLTLLGKKLVHKNQRFKTVVKQVIIKNRVGINRWAKIVQDIVLLTLARDFKKEYHIGEVRITSHSIDSSSAAKADAHIWQAFPTIAAFIT
jgi:hypothetical protein